MTLRLPARRCKSSTFCVMSVSTTPAVSSRASAWWAAFGSACRIRDQTDKTPRPVALARRDAARKVAELDGSRVFPVAIAVAIVRNSRGGADACTTDDRHAAVLLQKTCELVGFGIHAVILVKVASPIKHRPPGVFA